MLITFIDLLFVGAVTVTFLVLQGLSIKNAHNYGLYEGSSSASSSSDHHHTGGPSWLGIIWKLFKGFPDFFFVGFLVITLLESLGSLVLVHSYLISTGKTTNEFYK